MIDVPSALIGSCAGFIVCAVMMLGLSEFLDYLDRRRVDRRLKAATDYRQHLH